MVAATDLAEVPSVGVAALDDDHRIILGVIVELREAIAEGDDHETLGSMVIFLCDHILTHLRREERLMDKLGYPGLASHRVAHAELIGWVDGFRAAYTREGGAWLNAERLTFPLEWWMKHIRTVDVLYETFFAARPGEVAEALNTEDLFEIYGFDNAPAEGDDPFLPGA
ncbi:MAG: hemerythrin family protein [Alphaproteobacteria bacterium]|nr:hemerythrin family protein [Alphaproteobacteria bacterium]MBF0129393.1 hemerythrin family protein [Alphaproteobacteria bacterium]